MPRSFAGFFPWQQALPWWKTRPLASLSSLSHSYLLERTASPDIRPEGEVLLATVQGPAWLGGGCQAGCTTVGTACMNRTGGNSLLPSLLERCTYG